MALGRVKRFEIPLYVQRLGSIPACTHLPPSPKGEDAAFRVQSTKSVDSASRWKKRVQRGVGLIKEALNL